jgi:hypothetical protein
MFRVKPHAIISEADEEPETELSRANLRHISYLHQDRIKKNERNFLNVVEKNPFEKLDTWIPISLLGKISWR